MIQSHVQTVQLVIIIHYFARSLITGINSLQQEDTQRTSRRLSVIGHWSQRKQKYKGELRQSDGKVISEPSY
jgi:hypothetical protein